MNTYARLSLAAVIVIGVGAPIGLSAQAPAATTTKPSFEVASIKLNKSGEQGARMLGQPGGRVTVTNFSLRGLIRNAYRMQDFQISEGPGWITSDRFDINAKADGDPAPDQMQLMLQSLLEERFNLVVHKETRDVPVYALVLAKADGKVGRNLVRSDIDCAALGRAKIAPPAPPLPTPSEPRPVPQCGMRTGNGRLTARAATIVQLGTTLASMVNRVVLDRTGLAGSFDIDLEWTPEQTVDTSGASIFTALQEQLGLRLDPARGPVEMLVIDRVEQPTPD
jgi:uncharacterized protein (TIGR03435 family)